MSRFFYANFACNMKEKILSKELILDDYYKVEKWIFQYEKDNAELTEPIDRLLFKRPDSAAIIVFNTETKKVLLVRQFRHCTYDKGPGWIIETVAGGIEEGESYADAAKREAIEEIGYQVHNVEKISTFYASPGCSTERMIVFYGEVTNADKVADGGGMLDEQEFVTTVEFTLDELNAAILNDEINDAKTVIGANYLLRKQGY